MIDTDTTKTTEKTGWALLHSKLPTAAIRPLSEKVYGVGGLSDVNEAYLIQRLFASGLSWEWRLLNQSYLGSEDRTIRGQPGKPDYQLRYYMASVQGELLIEGRMFHGAGAHDNRKLDAAFKGAATVAFKNACKIAGLTIELFKDGKAMDFIYEDRDGRAATGEIPVSQASVESVDALAAAQNQMAESGGPEPPPSGPTPTPVAENPTASAKRSVGPRAKRQNVVPAPVGAPSERSEAAVESPPAMTSTPPPAPDPGRELYLVSLRAQAQEAAAQLHSLNTIRKNKKLLAANQATIPVPPSQPNQAASDALARYITKGRKEFQLNAGTLEELNETSLARVISELEGLIERLKEK